MAITRFCISPAPAYAAPIDAPENRVFRGRPEQPRTRLVTDVLAIGDSITDYVTPLCRLSGWTLATRRAGADGVSFVNDNRVAVAICAASFRDGSWQDLALAVRAIPHAPALIVVSDDADLTKNVIAFGGFDVLVPPLSPGDVAWSVASAWHGWWKRYEATEGRGRCFDA
jgi:hypothetical protein